MRQDSRGTPMSEKLIRLLRQRVENRFYDRPEVVDALARAMLGYDALK